jgi:hypothetical protein
MVPFNVCSMAVGKIAGLPRTCRRTKRIDTIPKPCGLGSEGPLSGLYVPVLSRTCPTFVSVLSRFCATSFCAPEDPWKTSFTMF